MSARRLQQLAVVTLAWGWGLGPASAAPAEGPADDPTTKPAGDVIAQPESAAPEDPARTAYAEQAPLDVATLLGDTSKAYLQARARLTAYPDLATSAILDRLDAVPAPTKGERKRLFDVLGDLGGPSHLPLFAKELRRAVGSAEDGSGSDEAAAKWLPLIVAQGAAAAPELSKLVGDKELLMSVRATALDAWVEVTPPAELGGLVVLVGRGSPTLRGQLTRSLKRRVAADTTAREGLLSATDSAIDAAIGPEQAPSRAASLLQFRSAVSSTDDAALSQRLAALASDAQTAFVLRVAAVRGLSRQDNAVARAALRDVAEASLTPANEGQSAEILAWLSLSGLPDDDARAIASTRSLHDASAPRLAALGYKLGALPTDGTWIEPSQANPWPQVRQAALARVQGPCAKTTVKLLARRARPKTRDGDKDPAVARSNVQALGRCGPEALDALVDLLNAGAVDIEQRTEAARQLTKHHGAAGADAVAAALLRDPPRRLARRLVSALRWVKTPTPKVTESLCRAAAMGDNTSPQAVATLELLHADPSAACN